MIEYVAVYLLGHITVHNFDQISYLYETIFHLCIPSWYVASHWSQFIVLPSARREMNTSQQAWQCSGWEGYHENRRTDGHNRLQYPARWRGRGVRQLHVTIRYDRRCCFNVRSKADTSQLNLSHVTVCAVGSIEDHDACYCERAAEFPTANGRVSRVCAATVSRLAHRRSRTPTRGQHRAVT